MTGSALQCKVITRERLYGLSPSGTRNRLVLVQTPSVKLGIKLRCRFIPLGHPLRSLSKQSLHRYLLELSIIHRTLPL